MFAFKSHQPGRDRHAAISQSKEACMVPSTVQSSGSSSWWVGFPYTDAYFREADRRASAMSASPIGKQIDGTQGLYAFVAKGPMQAKRTVRES